MLALTWQDQIKRVSNKTQKKIQTIIKLYFLSPIGPKHSPINVTAENITSPTQIPVSWKPIVEPGLEEKLLGYKVSWRVVSEGLEEKEEQPWETISVRKDSLYHTIERLKNFVHYQVEVSGFTRGGYGPSGITFAGNGRYSEFILEDVKHVQFKNGKPLLTR